MRRYIYVIVLFSFTYMMASWVIYLITRPEQPYLWWRHILVALLSGITFAIVNDFFGKRKKKEKK